MNRKLKRLLKKHFETGEQSWSGPRLMTCPPRELERITITLPTDLIAYFEIHAEVENKSFSNLVASFLRDSIIKNPLLIDP